MAKSWLEKLLKKPEPKDSRSWIRRVIAGSIYKMSDIRCGSSISDIKTIIETSRALARDSQIATALSYYATDGTTLNTAGQCIWAVSAEGRPKEGAEVANELLKRWKVTSLAREHILELGTVGNLYIPTSVLYRDDRTLYNTRNVVIDNNTIADADFDIIPSYKLVPEDIVHIYKKGQALGYIYQPKEERVEYEILPECACIHFSLGGLLGDYTIQTLESDGNEQEYEIKFAHPMMESATQPTQTLNLLEDALILSSLIRTIKFINVECGAAEEEEVSAILQDIKDSIEQQLSLNTSTGSVDSFVNPQSPNNLIYLPKIKGADAVSITDLNMSESTNEDSKLLDYYQDKKLSVLGVPKEAMNFSSNEGLGGAGAVLSQRSSLYANSLQRLKTAYMEGWSTAINMYFEQRGLSGLQDSFELRMSEIITNQSTLTFDKRDSAVSQASSIVDLLKTMGVTDADSYKSAISEILADVLPITGGKVGDWRVKIPEEGSDGDAY